MASLYKRPRSPFWWIKYRHHLTGKIVQESTGFKIGIGPETRKADELCAEKTLSEKRSQPINQCERWDNWTPAFLKARYGAPHQEETLIRYKTIWRNLAMFLTEKEIITPRQLTRAHCMEYFDWRLAHDRKKGKYKACRNTAILEMKILGLIMREAVQRGYALFNPCRELAVKKDSPRVKPELTDEEVEFIRAKIQNEPDDPPIHLRTFLSRSFEIARYQGCRLKETMLNPQTAVTTERDANNKITRATITFLTKGRRVHTAPLHPALFQLFEDLIDGGAIETYPDQGRRASRRWHDFLKRCGMKKLKLAACFHSLRVTVVTKLARSNTKDSKAMRYVGHASTTVHRIYQRLRPDDLDDCVKALV